MRRLGARRLGRRFYRRLRLLLLLLLLVVVLLLLLLILMLVLMLTVPVSTLPPLMFRLGVQNTVVVLCVLKVALGRDVLAGRSGVPS